VLDFNRAIAVPMHKIYFTLTISVHRASFITGGFAVFPDTCLLIRLDFRRMNYVVTVLHIPSKEVVGLSGGR